MLALGVSVWRSGAWEEQRLRSIRPDELRALAAARPDDARVQRRWAERLLERGELVEAERTFRQAAEADPSDGRAWTGWGNVTLALGRPRPALEILKRSAEQWPESSEAHFGAAAAYTALGDTGSALPHWREGLRRAPRKPEAWVAFGQALEAQGETAEAERAFGKALGLRPGDRGASLGRARCLQKLGRGGEARPLLDALLRADPSDLEARMLLGELLIARGDATSRGAGMKEIARAAAFHPEAPGPHRRVGELWMEDEAFPDAAQAFAQAADREPSNETHFERAADAYLRLNLPEQARSFQQRAAEVREWKRQLEHLSREAAASPRDPRPLLEHARLCRRLQLIPEAVHDYRRVLSLQPSNKEASSELPRLERLL
ncbi:MAG TPA: tetratricopeptide repeat protein, partial [Armatimonadota bacterium]|nr:tetratricopeptide repeat protein [Armatimonadota bacterium]